MDIVDGDPRQRRVLEVELDVSPALEPERRSAFVRAKAEEARHRHHVALPGAAAGDALQLAQLLEGVDPHVRVGADADADSAGAELLDRNEAVAEVRLGGGADTDPRTGLGDEVELVAVRMRGVDDGRVRAEAAGSRQQLDRPLPVLGDAFLDLAWLLV